MNDYSNAINQYIIDTNGTMYIGLFNIDNRFCYYISALQRLHSSKTLNKILQSSLNIITNPNDLQRINPEHLLLLPLRIYADIDNKNLDKVKQIHDNIANVLSITVKMFNDNMQHGGNPDHVLMSLMIPTLHIYLKNPETLKQIVSELYINPNRLNHLLYSKGREYDFKITNNENYNKALYNAFNEVAKIFENVGIKSDKLFNFNCSTMAIMFKDETGLNSTYNGHAINLVYGSSDTSQAPNLYIIDDSVGISAFQNFIERHRNRIGYFEIKDATDKILQLIKNVNGVDIDKRLHRDVINVNGSVLSGGSNSKHEEIVNECNWYPFVEVKDVPDENAESSQEIYGEIGAKIENVNYGNINDINDFNNNDSNFNQSIINENTNQNFDQSVINTNQNINQNMLGGDVVPLRIKILNQMKTKLNKYISIAIIISIIIIIIIMVIRYNTVKNYNSKIESYKKKTDKISKDNEKLKSKARSIVSEIQKKKKADIVEPSTEIKKDTFTFDKSNITPESKLLNVNRPNANRNLSGMRTTLKPKVETYKYIPSLQKPLVHNGYKLNFDNYLK